MHVLHFGVVLLVAAVLVEIAVVVPVIVTQRNADIAEQHAKLGMLTDQFVVAVNGTVNQFIYNVLRTSGAATLVPGFLTQQDLATSLELEHNPSSTPALLFAWVPLISFADKDAFESFYGFPITQLNGTSIVNATQRTVYAPLCLFEPVQPTTTAGGFDLLSSPITSVLLKNESLYLFPHATLFESAPYSFGLLIISFDSQHKGYVIGRVGAEELLGFSLQVPRNQTIIAAFDASAAPEEQLLFYDNIAILQNTTTVAAFNALPNRNEFYVRNLTVLGDDIMLCIQYDYKLASSYKPSTWIILVAVLVPSCCCIDIVIIGLVLLWQNRLTLQHLEKEKREQAQIMLGYVNHEIRNPLQTILGLTELCVEELEGVEANARLISNMGTIIRSAEFIEHIANDILDVRRIEEGKITLEVADVDVNFLISGLEKSIQPLFSGKTEVIFRVDRASGLDILRTDRYRLGNNLVKG
jgi:hypothetical protein